MEGWDARIFIPSIEEEERRDRVQGRQGENNRDKEVQGRMEKSSKGQRAARSTRGGQQQRKGARSAGRTTAAEAGSGRERKEKTKERVG